MYGKGRRILCMFISFIFAYCVFYISIVLLRFGFISASNNIFFVVIGIYLCSAALKYHKISGIAETFHYEDNEKINKNLRRYIKKGDAIEGISLKNDEDSITIDNLVFTDKGVFNMVRCSLKGEIEIDEDGNWYRISRRKKDKVKSPIAKIKENRKILAKDIKEDAIIDVIVVVNDRTDIYGEENTSVPIIRYEEIDEFIEDYEGKNEYSKDKLYDALYHDIIKTKDTAEEKKNYNNYLDCLWNVRSRLAFSSAFFVIYFINIMYS